MTRVTFTAGRRGRRDLFSRDAVLRGLATRFSCGPGEVPAAIDKLARTAEVADATLTTMRGRLADAIVASFSGSGPVIAEIPSASGGNAASGGNNGELLRSVGAKLVTAGRDALLCMRDGEAIHVVLFRAQGSTLDCGALFKQLSATYGGRGGGKADRAEGRLTGPIASWPEAVAELV